MKIDKSITITVIIVAAVLLAVNMFLGSINPQTDTVNVQGVSKIKVVPDLMTINFNIETTGADSKTAKDANSKILNNLIEALMLQGFEREEIQTQNFNVYPDYEYSSEGKRTELGYRATHSVSIELPIDDSDKSGAVIDAGVNAGAGVSYINFELTQESQSKYKAQAMKLAAIDARTKAEAVAEGFDKRVGDLVSTSVNDFGYYPWNVYSSAGSYEKDAVALESVRTNIQPTEQEISASVTAVYKLK
jgi:hypothetical protein